MSEQYYTQLKINNSQFFEASILGGSYSSSVPLGDSPCTPDILTFRLYLPLAQNVCSTYPIGSSVTYFSSTQSASYTVEKLFLKQLNRISRYVYEFVCVSPVGLLENSIHYGGIYNNVSLSSVLSDIVGGKFSYTVSSAVSGIPVCGWLPIATRLQNLRQLLTACGVLPIINSTGNIIFTTINRDMLANPGYDRVLNGQRIENIPDVSCVNVTEHSFSISSQTSTSTLFYGYVPSETIIAPSGTTRTGSLITFASPVHSLTVTGSTILESGANYAVISPSDSASLTGKYYTHSRRIVSAKNSFAEENVRNYKNLTLVSLLNSENVAARILAYYTGRKRLRSAFIPLSENSGTAVSMPTATDETVNGIISSFKKQFTRSNRTDVTVDDYTDSVPPGNSFSRVNVISTNGSYTVPSGVSRIRIVLIGGGDGGDGGNLGADGTGGVSKYSNIRNNQSVVCGNGGAGGAGGSAGSGGRVFITTVTVTPGSSYSVNIGNGGSAGVGITHTTPEGTLTTASSGTDTLFGSYSSANGTASESGYYDTVNQVAYALPGINGKNGGDGGNGGSVPTVAPASQTSSEGNGVHGANGSTGLVTSTTGTSDGGNGGAYKPINYSVVVGYYYCCGGGGGGGSNNVTPSASASGGIGSGSLENNPSISNGFIANLCGGDGGNGSSAVNAASIGSSCFGCGGNGGNGGGGGGGGGAAMLDYSSRSGGATVNSLHTTYASGQPGVGGNGANGSSGIKGCVLVYY